MVDQARYIADRLEMTSRFHPAMRVEAEEYGDDGEPDPQLRRKQHAQRGAEYPAQL